MGWVTSDGHDTGKLPQWAQEELMKRNATIAELKWQLANLGQSTSCNQGNQEIDSTPINYAAYEQFGSVIWRVSNVFYGEWPDKTSLQEKFELIDKILSEYQGHVNKKEFFLDLSRIRAKREAKEHGDLKK